MDHVEEISYQPFVAVSGNLGRKVPVVDDVLSSHEPKIYRTTSLDGNCVEFEFQAERNSYVDFRQAYLTLKLKLVKGHGYETYNTEEIKKEHKKKEKRLRKWRQRTRERLQFLLLLM